MNNRKYFSPSECNVSVDAVVCSSAFRLPYVASFSECNVPVEAVAYNTNSRNYFPPSERNMPVDAVVCRGCPKRVWHLVQVEDSGKLSATSLKLFTFPRKLAAKPLHCASIMVSPLRGVMREVMSFRGLRGASAPLHPRLHNGVVPMGLLKNSLCV